MQHYYRNFFQQPLMLLTTLLSLYLATNSTSCEWRDFLQPLNDFGVAWKPDKRYQGVLHTTWSLLQPFFSKVKYSTCTYGYYQRETIDAEIVEAMSARDWHLKSVGTTASQNKKALKKLKRVPPWAENTRVQRLNAGEN